MSERARVPQRERQFDLMRSGAVTFYTLKRGHSIAVGDLVDVFEICFSIFTCGMVETGRVDTYRVTAIVEHDDDPGVAKSASALCLKLSPDA